MLVSAETKGNGIEGEDILHNAMVIPSIPKKIPYTGEMTVDGEIICKTDVFEEFKGEYANPRNFAAGSIRLLDSKVSASRKLTFVAWDMFQEQENQFTRLSEKLQYLISLNFKVVYFNALALKFSNAIIEDLKLIAEHKRYPIDGLVVKYNKCSEYEACGRTDHHFKGGIAFKFYDEEYETYLTGIDWTMGRTGILTPVAILDPIEIDGTTVERASLHNISIMKELLGEPYHRQEVKVFKANEIIPQISSAKKLTGKREEGLKLLYNIPTICPICGGALDIECEVNTEVLKCNNFQCPGQLVNRLDHFCGKKGLDIKGLSKATLSKLVELEWVNEPADLYNLQKYRSEWIKLPGFGEKSVDKILAAIENSRTAKLDAFICSLGIPLVGKTLSKELVKHIHTYEEFRNKIQERWDFTELDGVAYEKASSILNFNYDEADKVYDCMFEVKVEEAVSANKTLEGKKIVVTGSLRKVKNRGELQSLIEAAGGRVVGSISRNTDMLINNDINSTSSKNIAAKKLNIPILTEEDLFNLYLIF
jgi:DNA ligase (NAD+)